MNTAETLMQKKQTFKVEMEKNLTKEQCDVLWKEATEKLDQTMKQYNAIPKGFRMHTERIFPAASVYLTLKGAIGQEKAFRIIEDAAVSGCEPIQTKLACLMKLPGMKSLFVKIWDPMVRRIFGPENGFKNVFYPKKKGEYRMDVIACPYCRFFAELGCPELTKVFCDNDERIYGNLPGLKFERTGTLGKGAARCDFCLRRVKEA